jgi:hypothetical protein
MAQWLRCLTAAELMAKMASSVLPLPSESERGRESERERERRRAHRSGVGASLNLTSGVSTDICLPYGEHGLTPIGHPGSV